MARLFLSRRDPRARTTRDRSARRACAIILLVEEVEVKSAVVAAMKEALIVMASFGNAAFFLSPTVQRECAEKSRLLCHADRCPFNLCLLVHGMRVVVNCFQVDG